MHAATKFVATFAYTGFFPGLPATFASLVFAALYFFVPGGGWLVHPVVVAATVVLAVPVSAAMEKEYGEDPSCVVIDEIVGMQVVLVGATGVGLAGILAAFLLFRVFDMAKPFPVNRSQRLPGGWGIVVDDILAALYTRVVLVLAAMAWPSVGNFVP